MKYYFIFMIFLGILIPLHAISYSDTVVADNPIAYWRFDENVGANVAQDEIGSSSGTYINEAEPGQEGTLLPGMSDSKSVYFDGVDDHIDVPDSSTLDITGSFSIELWMKSAVAISDQSDWAMMVNKFDSSGDRTGFLIQAAGYTGEIALLFYDDAHSGIGVSSTNVDPVAANTWAHVAGVYDKEIGKISLYINGQLDNSSIVGSHIVSTNDEVLRIGAQSDWLGGNLFNGFLDDVAIYNTALTDSNILSHYQAAMGIPVTTIPEISSIFLIIFGFVGLVLKKKL